MSGRESVVLAGLVFVAGVVLALAVAHAAAAAVYEPSAEPGEPPRGEMPVCSEMPEPYEGEDPVAGELRLLRGEAVAACKSGNARLDALLDRVWWVVSEAVRAGEQRQLSNTLLSELKERLSEPLDVQIAGVDGGSLPVDAPGNEASLDGLQESVDASANSAREVEWFMVGLLLSLFAVYVFYRQVMPRA